MYERSEPLPALTAPPCGEGRGILVFGAPRGGTSMVAGALCILGVDMGARQGVGNNEDLDLQDARGGVAELGNPESEALQAAVTRMRPLIERRSEADMAWGWKDPHGVLYAAQVQDLLPAARMICVFRDPHAAAERIHLLTQTPLLTALDETLTLYQRCRTYLESCCLPASLVSYEKVLVRSDRFVEQLIEFCGLSPTGVQTEAAIAFCYPERGHGSPNDPGWPRQGAL